jgi:hypothetical protein
MNGAIEVALRRTGMRGRATVDRLEKFPAEFSVKDGVLYLSWKASNGQQNDLDCPLTPELRETLIEVLGSHKDTRQPGSDAARATAEASTMRPAGCRSLGGWEFASSADGGPLYVLFRTSKAVGTV